MEVLLLESFYGGSHRDVADSIAAHSSHRITMRTLPARFWKWRMRGAALTFARKLGFRANYDLVFCSGLMDLAAFKALLGGSCPPVVLYCHETQLAYPQPTESEADLHFAFTDLVNMLAADQVLFNSRSHLDRFLEALPGFLRRLPEHRPMWATESVAARACVCYPGIRPILDSTSVTAKTQTDNQSNAGAQAPLIIWNHRWEFDKNPAAFFNALRMVRDNGVDFRIAVLGENFSTVPPEFADARDVFGDRIVQFGYVKSRTDYERWLDRGNIIVSTAIQENFGISVMEAIAHGCHPILPNRLSYPELIPQAFHRDCLYSDPGDLVTLLTRILSERRAADEHLVNHARSFEWPARIAEFDRIMEETAGRDRG